MACTAIDLQTAYVSGANAAIGAAGVIETPVQTAARQATQQAMAVAAYPLPGPPLRVAQLTLTDSTVVQVRVNAGVLERLNNQTQLWQAVGNLIPLDKVGPQGLYTIASLFAQPTAG